eukprot:CAMPEP_0196771408 /NCGR_PEP_ID=MMETSP1104-20130614/1668_1 /TAXON_ID=33652 /ORGANISM="Cafeteria sp., Strain Caron Lab Isolate" /LENGTH=386 /DNA_ID=CAMNT_0042141527 /DNA_START=132 /DNA_END=1292 /DNA_ORIENTATION=-
MSSLREAHELRLKMALEACSIAVGLIGAVFFGAGLYAEREGGLFGVESWVIAMGVATFAEAIGGLVFPKSEAPWLRLLVFFVALVLSYFSFFFGVGSLFFKEEFLMNVNFFWREVSHEFPDLYGKNDTLSVQTARDLVDRDTTTIGLAGLLNFLALGGVAIFSGLLLPRKTLSDFLLYWLNVALLALGIFMIAWAVELDGQLDLAGSSALVPWSLGIAGAVAICFALVGFWIELITRRFLRRPVSQRSAAEGEAGLNRINRAAIVYCVAISVCAVLLLTCLISGIIYAARVDSEVNELTDEDFNQVVSDAGLDPNQWTRDQFIVLLQRNYMWLTFLCASFVAVLIGIVLTVWSFRGNMSLAPTAGPKYATLPTEEKEDDEETKLMA